MVAKSLFIIVVTLAVAAELVAQNSEKQISDASKRPITFSEITQKLAPSLEGKINLTDMNNQIIIEIRSRGVDFLIEDGDRNELKRNGANDELFKAIEVGLSEKHRERAERQRDQKILYREFIDNLPKRTEPQMRASFEAAKKFVELYQDDPEVREIIDYMKAWLPRMENNIKSLKKPSKTVN